MPPPSSFRGYAEMLYSGALSPQQAADIYTAASGSSCGPRLLVLGSPALDGAAISTPTAYGLAYGPSKQRPGLCGASALNAKGRCLVTLSRR